MSYSIVFPPVELGQLAMIQHSNAILPADSIMLDLKGSFSTNQQSQAHMSATGRMPTLKANPLMAVMGCLVCALIMMLTGCAATPVSPVSPVMPVAPLNSGRLICDCRLDVVAGEVVIRDLPRHSGKIRARRIVRDENIIPRTKRSVSAQDNGCCIQLSSVQLQEYERQSQRDLELEHLRRMMEKGLLTHDYLDYISTKTRAVRLALSGVVGSIALSPEEGNRVILSALTMTDATDLPFDLLESTFRSQTAALSAPTARWTIAESTAGQIVTDWGSAAGRRAGALWWEKTYETQIRHILTISRSLASPALIDLSISTETRERPNASWEWKDADPELGRAAFEEFKNFVIRVVRAHSQRQVADAVAPANKHLVKRKKK